MIDPQEPFPPASFPLTFEQIRQMTSLLKTAHLDYGPAVPLTQSQQPILACYVALEKAVQSLCALDLAVQRYARIQQKDMQQASP